MELNNKLTFDLSYIEKTISKHITSYEQTDIAKIINCIQDLWSIDVVIKNYTSHKLDHNLRVLEYCYKLIEANKINLDSTGYYIITLAALLHDIGMQCNDDIILSKYFPKGISNNEEEYQIQIRKNHAKIAIEWIAKLQKKSIGSIGKVIGLINPSQLKAICDVLVLHSGKDIFDVQEPHYYTHHSDQKELMPLSIILRLADELDIGSERSNEDAILFSKLPIDSLSYFWLHKITKVSFYNGTNVIKLSIELNPEDTDKESFFKEIIFDSFVKKNKTLFQMLKKYCSIVPTIEYGFTENPYFENFDYNVYDYLLSKKIESSSFSDKLDVKYITYDIVEVFNLDKKLLPSIYVDVNYAVTKEQSQICCKRNPYMTITAHKGKKLIGYLTLWPVYEHVLIKLLSFELLESELNHNEDLLIYKTEDSPICWYISGLGVCNEERGRKNHPLILDQLLNKSLDLVRDVLKPRNIKVSKIGALVYSREAEALCLRSFKMNVFKEADYKINDFTPTSFITDINTSKSEYVMNIKKILS